MAVTQFDTRSRRAPTRVDVLTLVEPPVQAVARPYDGLWAGVAVLDHRGVIVSTNAAWELFETVDGGRGSAVGMNYIHLCERSGARMVGQGLRSVLSGECAQFDITYACPSPIEDRWYLLQAAASDGGVLLTHTNVTGQMLVSDSPDLSADEDPVTRLPMLTRGLGMIDQALSESASTGVPTMIATIRLLDLADLVLSHGRVARDELVVQVVLRARRLMRSGDFLVRSGPAVLMLVAKDVDDRNSAQLLEELVRVLASAYHVGPFALLARIKVDVVTSDLPATVESLLQLRPGQVQARHSAARDSGVPPDAHDLVHTAIIGSPLPMIVFSLPDQRVRAANRAAADLLGMTPAELTRRSARRLFLTADGAKPTLDLSALAAGALESYRAKRTLVGADGPVEASIWVRSIPRRSGAMALLLVLPADHDDQFQLPTRALMGPLAVDLASGTMNELGDVVTLSRSNPGVLHSQRDNQTGGRQLVAHVHPKDRVSLKDGLDSFRENRRNQVIAVRIRHAHRGWIATDCMLFPTGDDSLGEPIGFVLAEASAVVPVSGRVATLENHLTRLAAEVHAAGFGLPEPSPDSQQCKDLSSLTARQRDIVHRLCDGQRVPTIAAELYISSSTVRNHLAGVFKAFDVHSQSELLARLRTSD